MQEKNISKEELDETLKNLLDRSREDQFSVFGKTLANDVFCGVLYEIKEQYIIIIAHPEGQKVIDRSFIKTFNYRVNLVPEMAPA